MSESKKSLRLDKSIDGMSPGEIIKYKRVSVFRMSQEEFADEFKVPVGTLRNWEQGANEPPAYFLKFVESEERHHKNIYKTPIEEKRHQIEDAMSLSDGRLLMRDFALDKLDANPSHRDAYDMLNSMLDEGGMFENLQNISSLYDELSLSDAISLAQLVLLQKINDKLDKLL